MLYFFRKLIATASAQKQSRTSGASSLNETRSMAQQQYDADKFASVLLIVIFCRQPIATASAQRQSRTSGASAMDQSRLISSVAVQPIRRTSDPANRSRLEPTPKMYKCYY